MFARVPARGLEIEPFAERRSSADGAAEKFNFIRPQRLCQTLLPLPPQPPSARGATLSLIVDNEGKSGSCSGSQ